MAHLIECQRLGKTYGREGENVVPIFDDLALSIESGEFLSIVGPSGSGKSTLLHLMAGLDQPSDGIVLWRGRSWQDLADAERATIRSNHLGFVYQFHHLLSELTALENVAITLQIKGENRKAALTAAKETLSAFGLDHRFEHFLISCQVASVNELRSQGRLFINLNVYSQMNLLAIWTRNRCRWR